MPAEILGVGKLVLLGLLYLFLWRVLRTIAKDLRDPARVQASRSSAAPRPAVAEPARKTSARRSPTEVVLHPAGRSAHGWNAVGG